MDVETEDQEADQITQLVRSKISLGRRSENISNLSRILHCMPKPLCFHRYHDVSMTTDIMHMFSGEEYCFS